jgi:hypothetical protein
MEMQQMLAHLLAEMRSGQGKMIEEMKASLREEIKSGQAEMRSTVSALGDKMGALITGMKDGQKEMVACQETKEACLEWKEPSPKEMEFEVEVPMEEAAAKTSRIIKKRHRGWHLAAGRSVKPKKLTRGDCGSQGKLAATRSKVSRHAAVAWRKRNLSRKIRTRGNCGSLRKLTVAGRKMICCARVARCKTGVIRKDWIRTKVERETRKAGTRHKGNMGRKELGCRWPLYLRRKRTTTDSIRQWISEQPRLKSKRTTSGIYRKTIGLEVVKQATEMSAGLLKMWNWTLWRGRPPPKWKKSLLAVLT